MRLIDATTLKAEFTGNFNDGYYPVGQIKAIIDTAPTINAIPIDKAAEFLANYQVPAIKFPEGKYFVVMSHEEVVQEWKKILMEAMEK